MEFIQNFDFNKGDLAAMQVSCLKVEEPPAEHTRGAVGLFAMVESTGQVYKCVAADDEKGVYSWQDMESASSGAFYVPVTRFLVGDNVLTADKVGTAAGWSFDGSVFTHTPGEPNSGADTPLRIAMGDLAVAGDEWLISFENTGITGDVLYLSFGSEAKTQTYNGTRSNAVALKVKADGDDLLLTPTRLFDGTLSNFQIRKISENGTELYEFKNDSVMNADKQNAKTGFWNVVLGTEHTMTKAINSSRTIAIGHNALHSIISGNRNIGIGTFALQQLHDGEDNLAIGADCMGYIDSAKRCTAFGVKSLVGYTENIVDAVAIGNGAGLRGNQLTAIGSNAGCANQGDDNTFIGCRAGAYNTTGSRNIIIGSYTEGQPAGMFNVIIGRNANYPNNANNCIAIGKNAVATKSNQVVIGSAETTEVVLGGKKLTFNDDGTVTWETA